VRKTSILGIKMSEKKRRQVQRGVTTKSICPKCGKYMRRCYLHESTGARSYIGACWICSTSTCDYIAKDVVELEDKGEPVDNAKDFAEACCDQNSLKELKGALAGEADEMDMKTWSLTEDQWRKALEVAIIAIENNLSVDEAIKCLS
jgi:hypothetical protein